MSNETFFIEQDIERLKRKNRDILKKSKIFVIPYIYLDNPNCTSELQSLINIANLQGYNHIIFEEGIYYVNNLRFKSNTIYEGYGNVVFKSKNGAVIWSLGVLIKDIQNVIVTNIKFDGNKEGVYGTKEVGVTNLRIENANNIIIEYCDFYNNYYGNIYSKNCDTVEIKNCDFKSSDVAILFMQIASVNIYIHDNIVDGINGTSEGISIFDCDDKSSYHENIRIYDNIVKNKTGSEGIRIVQAKSVEVYLNKVENCMIGIGVVLPGEGDNSTILCDRIDISNNKIKNSLIYDISFDKITNSYIQNNKSENSLQQFISGTNSTNVIINENKAMNYNASNYDYGTGIEITECNNLYITNNTLISNNLKYSVNITSNSDAIKSSNIYICNNTFLPITNTIDGTISCHYLRTSNIVMSNNIASIGVQANNSKCDGNVGLKSSIRIAIIPTSWGGISVFDDEVLYLDTTSLTLITNCTIDNSSIINSYAGKKLTLISKTNLIQFIASSILSFKGGVSTYTPVIGEVLNFIFDGTKWIQI